MGAPCDDVVVIQKGKNPGEPCVITINCPDKTGLGCDICRVILEFGLYISKAGMVIYAIISTFGLKSLTFFSGKTHDFKALCVGYLRIDYLFLIV